jgi:hypothetical protein
MLWRPWAGASTLSALYNFGKSRDFSLGIDRAQRERKDRTVRPSDGADRRQAAIGGVIAFCHPSRFTD